MSDSTTTTTTTTNDLYHDASGYWKLCTMVLGVGFVIAVASHAGPSSASASTEPNMLSIHQANVAAQASQTLSIGGFDSLDGQPAFVIVNQDGQRVGTLPMSAMSSD